MKLSHRAIGSTLAGLFLLVVMPAAASACSACMGNPNSRTAGAMNDAIFLMLGFVALMLSGITAFIFTLRKRAQVPMPPHVEMTSAMTDQENTK
jgi:hypothetical protein